MSPMTPRPISTYPHTELCRPEDILPWVRHGEPVLVYEAEVPENEYRHGVDYPVGWCVATCFYNAVKGFTRWQAYPDSYETIILNPSFWMPLPERP